jgi:hypothetical protein
MSATGLSPYFARLGDFATGVRLVRSNQVVSRKDAKAQSLAKVNQGITQRLPILTGI